MVRAVRIWSLAVYFLTQERRAQNRAKQDPEGASDLRYIVARKAKEVILELGPTFIKLGQLLSTRVDIMPKEYIEVLGGLQDNVPGFSDVEARAIIEREFNSTVEQLFDHFENQPLAAASLGQVHRAVLDGQDVIVKVQRQGLNNLFRSDLKILKYMARLMNKIDPSLDGTDRDWVGMYEENARLLYREIDYVNEGRNCDRFRENFENEPWIKVPKIFWSRVSEQVLTMEYVPGIKISDTAAIDACGIDRKVLAKRSAESYMTQLCRHGFFHCDPHPGNLACDAEEGGRLIYYDFGMMDEIPEEVRKGFVLLTFGVYDNDAKAVCNGAEQMGILRKDIDRMSIEIIAREFLTEFADTLASPFERWENELDAEQQRLLRKQRRARIGAELFMVGESKPFKLPASFTFVYRAFTTLDGIGKGLDPRYDLARLAQPYLRELADLKDGSVVTSLAKTWGKRLGWRFEDIAAVVQQPRKVNEMDRMLREMEEGKLKLWVRALELEQSVARMEADQNVMGTLMLTIAMGNAGLLLLLVPIAPDAALSPAATRLAGKVILNAASLIGILRLPRLLLRKRRIRIGALEPGQVQL